MCYKMAASSSRGTRKTYTFEEREILITLIKKYEDIEDKKSDPISMCKRKSAWSQLAEEYNSMVGPQGVRSAVQLRRCWENMKACKRNREERKSWNISRGFCQFPGDHIGSRSWEPKNRIQNTSDAPTSTGLPPNVVFEPKESEPFTLQSVCTLKPLKLNFKKDDNYRDSDGSGNKIDADTSLRGPMGDCSEKSCKDLDFSTIERSDEGNIPEKNRLVFRTNATQTLISPSLVQDPIRKIRKSVHREEELHVLALSEAQMKVDIATMLKEEARIKLEEAHYRKEEARLRMLFFTYKLDRIKED